MLAVFFVLAASLTLLPAVLAKLGPRVNRLAPPWAQAGEHRSQRLAAWAATAWRRPVPRRGGRPRGSGGSRLAGAPARDRHALDHGRARRRTVRAQGYDQVQPAFGEGAPGSLQVVAPRAAADDVRRGCAPTRASRRYCRRPGRRRVDAGAGRAEERPIRQRRSGTTIDRLRSQLPAGALGRWRRRREPRPGDARWRDATPLVIGVVLALGFLLLLVALQAPVIAAVGVLSTCFATLRRVRRRQAGLPGRRPVPDLLGFESQGFLERLGAGVLLRDALRARHGLHGVPALLGQGALGPHRRRARRGRRRASPPPAGSSPPRPR